MKKFLFTSLLLTANTFAFAQVMPYTRPRTLDEFRIYLEQSYYHGVIDLLTPKQPTFPPQPVSAVPSYQVIRNIASQLCEYVDTNSISVLIKLNQELMDTNKDGGQARLREILQILLCIESPMAVDAIFNLLDVADEKYGEKTVVTIFNQQTGKTLRENLMADIFEPYENKDNPPQWKTVVEGEKWQEMFKNYQSDKLSEKNKTFLTNARQRIQVKEDAKKEEDEK